METITVKELLAAVHGELPQGVGEFTDLDKAAFEAQVQAHADDAHHGGQAPDKSVENSVDLGNRFQKNSSS